MLKQLYRIGWAISAGVALAVSAFSLFYVARAWGLPVPLACGMSLVFDGAAIVSAELALRISRTVGANALGARITTNIFAGLSAWINSFHAGLVHAPGAARVFYAAPPVVAVVLFDQHARYEARAARRRAGRVAPNLPPISPSAWFLFPVRTPRLVRGLVGRQLDAIEIPTEIIPEQAASTRVIRIWAQSVGMDVAPTGALPKSVIEAYHSREETGVSQNGYKEIR
jgi:Protein of unknown function (DUF2637)